MLSHLTIFPKEASDRDLVRDLWGEVMFRGYVRHCSTMLLTDLAHYRRTRFWILSREEETLCVGDSNDNY